jgi:hypothetical protein
MHHVQDNKVDTFHHDMESNLKANVGTRTTPNGEEHMDVTNKSGDNVMGINHDTNMILN